MRLTVESIDWVKQMALFVWVSLICSLKGLTRTKGLSRKEVFMPDDLHAGALVFSCLYIGFSWVSSQQTFGMDLLHWLSWISSLPTVKLRNYQFLRSWKPISYNKSLLHPSRSTHTYTHAYIYTHNIYTLSFCFSGETWLIKSLSIF